MVPLSDRINRTIARKLLSRSCAWVTHKISNHPLNMVSAKNIIATRNVKRNFPHIMDRVSSVSDALQAIGKKVEPDFIHVGFELQSVYSQAKMLTEKILASAKLLDSKSEDSILYKIEKHVTDSLEGLAANQNEIRSNLNHIHEGVERLLKLYHVCPRFGKIASSLRLVGLNIGVESARSQDAEELFTVVAREIVLLSRRVMEIVDKIHEQAKKAHSGQVLAHKEISGDMETFAELSLQAKQAVNNAADEIEHLMKLSLGIMEQAATRSGKISKQIGQIVMGIQFHDKMSQRMDHIVKGLEDVSILVGNRGVSEKRYAGIGENVNSIRSILTLQAEQLFKVISEINTVHENGMLAFSEISKEIEEITDNLSGSGSGEKIILESENENAEDPFSALSSAVLNLKSLMGKGNDLIDKTRRTTTHASKKARMLSGYVKDVRGINVEAHLLAINATIKAAHLRDNGKTLEVLGQEMKNLSDQTNLLVGDVENNLLGLSETLECLKAEKRGTKNVSSKRGLYALLMNQHAQEMISHKEQFKEDCLDAIRMGAELQSAISGTLSGIEFLPRLSQELLDHHKEIEEICLTLAPLEDKQNDTSMQAVEMLSRRYTMQDERDTHEKLLYRKEEPDFQEMKDTESDINFQEKRKPEIDLEVAVDATSIESNEFGDNVELF